MRINWRTRQLNGQSPPFFHDGTERPINRPIKDQKLYYSGKSHQHSVKNVVLATANQIIFLSDTYEGKAHDKRIVDEANYTLPPGSILYQDSGFQGFTLKDVTICQPKKKPRGGELTLDEQAENSRISSIRIHIEHIIGDVKRFAIVRETIRFFCDTIRDLVMETCCGLHNFLQSYKEVRSCKFEP